MRNTAPRATAVLKRGTHCWMDEAAVYAAPTSQCQSARDVGTIRTGPRAIHITRGGLSRSALKYDLNLTIHHSLLSDKALEESKCRLIRL